MSAYVRPGSDTLASLSFSMTPGWVAHFLRSVNAMLLEPFLYFVEVQNDAPWAYCETFPKFTASFHRASVSALS
jgi:hypothetical protein